MPTGVVATASWAPGRADRPAVLLLHGFLQTRHYLTISGMAAELEALGHSVLVPTLSLGIDRRRRSLDCEAVHAHTLEQDVAEIGRWVEWLVARGHQRIVLIGHSSGSMELLAYAAGAPHPAVEQLIATSLVDLDHRQVTAGELRTARERAAAGDASLRQYQLSYCESYTAPAKAFVSYARWSAARILDAIETLELPVVVIMGGEDRRMAPHWPQQLRARGIRVNVIAGANHFFSAQNEFALYDELVAVLEPTAVKGGE